MTLDASDKQTEARRQLSAAGIPIGSNFHALRTDQVSALLAEADLCRYRASKSANGSRGRYFHDMLQRRATRKES